ncbi:MAG: PhoX family protein [Nocardioides sp.]
MTVTGQRARELAPAASPEDVVVAWGDRVVPEAPSFRPAGQTAKAAAGQVGFGVERLGSLPLSSSKALLALSHVHGPDGLPLTGEYDAATAARISMAAHGFSVVGVRRSRRTGAWLLAERAQAPYNRRLHGGTICKLTGPAAGDRRVRTAADPAGTHVRGTFGNNVGTVTPWGSVLSAEGRFADYFESSGEIEPALVSSFARYGLGGAGRGWACVDRRFDLSQEPAEAFRYGWVVHLDPRRPSSRPRKLTMLGRLAHVAARATIADDGRAVIRLRDGHPDGHSYVYVSRDVVDHGTRATASRHNRKLLTTGTLHLVLPDPLPRGSEEHESWVPLTTDTTSHVPGLSVAGVLLDTRLATRRFLASR